MRVGAVPGPIVRVALCAAAATALALAASAVSRAAPATIYFHYAADCSFRIVDDGGAAVTTLAPGSYQIVVDTPFAFANETAACSFVQFGLTGPGVSVATTLGTGDSETELFTVTLQPSSTYVAQDDSAPARTRRTFTTAAGGSPTSAPTAGGGSASSSGGTKGGGSGAGSTSAIGTAIPTRRGTLVGTVGTDGKLTLTRNGKPVQILAAGRYDFSIADHSRSNGFTVQAARGSPITLSSGTYVGRKAKAITLARGQWLFYGSFVGKKSYFIVTA